MKTLIVYYSRRGENYGVGNIKEGNAEHIAKIIQKFTGADIYEIIPVKDYPSSYSKTTEIAKEELKKQVRPEFKNPLDSIDQYDTIYLCYPNWWGTYPRVVATFLEKYDFSNKIIKPMCTHEGSGFASSLIELKNTLSKSIVKPGLAIKGTEVRNSDERIKKWIEE